MTTARAEYVKNTLINVFFVVLKTHGNRTSAHLKLSEHLPLCGMYLIDKGILTRMFYQGTCANRSFQRSCCGLAWFLSLRPANIESTTIQKQHVSLPRNKQTTTTTTTGSLERLLLVTDVSTTSAVVIFRVK